MPSASVMMREIRTPLLVESKKRTGSRITCDSTSRRISVMARCAVTPRICESVNDVTAWTSDAPAAASASGTSSPVWCFPITLSIRYFEVVGRTSPASRFTSITASPTER